jgi:uncharacterized protein YciI
MFVIVLRYPDPEATAKLRDKHAAWIYKHADAGRFLMTGPMEPRTGGIIVADVPSRAELDAMLREDPYATAGTTYEVMEFHAWAGKFANEVPT